MSGKAAAVVLAAALLTNAPVLGSDTRAGIIFVGDILLARNVDREIRETRESPWRNIASRLRKASHVIGNLEGATGEPDGCRDTGDGAPCFVVAEDHLQLLAGAGFTALGLENNHSTDLGADRKFVTQQSLERNGVRGLTLKDSPWYFTVGPNVVGVVAYNEVAAPNAPPVTVPDVELAQKIRLAKQLANMVVVYVHWGNELQDWPSEQQRRHARWLIGRGADMVIGHHPHVIQGQECVDGRPVVYSLGNHVFDQKYPMTKTGQALECTFRADTPACRFLRTETPASSTFPASIEDDSALSGFWKSCQPKARPFQTIAGATARASPGTAISSATDKKIEFRSALSSFTLPAPELLSIAPVRFGNDDQDRFLLTLETRYSPLDKTTAPRPYVYGIGKRGLNAKWRGSALAWPLLDITTVRADGIDYLCALHRGDSFLAPDPDTRIRRTQVYRWNGFGFSAYESARLQADCERSYQSFLHDTES